MLIKRFVFLLGFAAVLYSSAPTRAQEPKEDIMRVRTRVVFVDTLVQDKKTGAPVADLTRANFEVLADGKPRTISYFSREGDVLRPLALIIFLNLELPLGEIRYLERNEIQAS